MHFLTFHLFFHFSMMSRCRDALWYLIEPFDFLKRTLTFLPYSHWDVDFQVRTCTYIHMDGVGFLVTGTRANCQGEEEERKDTITYMCCERLKFYLEKKRIH